MEIKVQSRQTLFDIALQQTGIADNALLIAIENGISVTDKLNSGDILTISGTEKGSDVLEVYQEKRIFPATAPNSKQEVLGGIEYMGIEIDFIVS